MKDDAYESKIRKMARMLRIAMQVFYWVSLAGVILLAVGGIVTFFLPDHSFIIEKAGNGGFTLSMDGLIRYKLDPQSSVGISTKPIYQSIAWMAVLCGGGLAVVFRQLTALLRTVEQKRPFAEENAKRCNVIGGVLLLGSFLFRAAGAMVASTMIDTLNIANMDVNISIDGFMFLSGFMMLVLGGIFKYGNYLQQEYDSTL